MKTFYDLKSSLHFNGLVGAIRTQGDLWAFYDILFSLQSDVIEASAAIYSNLIAQGQNKDDVERALYAHQLMVRMLEHDMQKIEAFCRSRGIEKD